MVTSQWQCGEEGVCPSQQRSQPVASRGVSTVCMLWEKNICHNCLHSCIKCCPNAGITNIIPFPTSDSTQHQTIIQGDSANTSSESFSKGRKGSGHVDHYTCHLLQFISLSVHQTLPTNLPWNVPLIKWFIGNLITYFPLPFGKAASQWWVS